MQRTMVGGLWMTDANFKASIYLKNIVETDSIRVKPTLFLSNGAAYALPDVTVEPAGIAIVSINDELQKLGISSWASLSGYVQLDYTWPWDPFCATIRNVDVAHSLVFTYFLLPTAPLSTNKGIGTRHYGKSISRLYRQDTLRHHRYCGHRAG